jgi:O-antigen ligase
MDKILKYVSRIAVILLIAAGVFITILIWIKGDDALKTEPLRNQILNPFMIIAYVAIIFCAFLAIIFPLIQLIQNPKRALTILIGIAAIAGLWFVSYSLSTGSVDPDFLIKNNTTESVARYVGAGMICTYIIFGATIIAALYSEISKAFK